MSNGEYIFKIRIIFVISCLLRGVVKVYVITSLSQLKEGMKLAKPIKTRISYEVLLQEGTILTQRHIDYLSQYYLDTIFVEVNSEMLNNLLGDDLKLFAKLPNTKAKKVYTNALYTIHNLFSLSKEGKELDLEPVKKVIDDLLMEISKNSNLMLQLATFKSYHQYTLTHSINVSIFSVFLGNALLVSPKFLKNLAFGGLLHDIGKTQISKQILDKPGPLDDAEFKIIKNHPEIGYNIIKANTDVDPEVLDIILHHHEKKDGTGYPDGLKNEEISLASKIVAVADIYDALTSDRSYRAKLLPHESIEYLFVNTSKKHLEEELVKTFINNVAIYPVGTMVELTDGRQGKVVGFPEYFPMRPIIQISGKRNEKINLLNNPNILIKKII